ncbi:hypothetical protein ANRL2_04511 [Anaerolineae bacterium]|nr:hypothetical protein ANRL2_04511 [Anaerolineae bacterium]
MPNRSEAALSATHIAGLNMHASEKLPVAQ